MQISGAEMNGNTVRLFVHVTDTGHSFYHGIPASAFCNPSVRYNGESYPIQNFRATEYRDVNREPAAYALVLDYSGSMRNNKTSLYLATHDLIQKKREQDAYSIIRYASTSTVDAPLSTEKQALLSRFPIEPYQNIGEQTATWDALVDGISTLEGSPYKSRTLVVFTDGGENASQVTQEWAFWRAKMAGVRIVAISLGTGGAQNMQDLCESTGGMYVPINHIDEVPNAYTDLKNKLGSFYLVEFETPFIGKQRVQLNLCDNIALYDTYAFDNRPPGPEPQRLKQPVPTTPATTSQPPVTSTPTTSTPRPTTPTAPTSSTPRPTPTQTSSTPRVPVPTPTVPPTRPTTVTTRPVTVSAPTGSSGGGVSSTPPSRGSTTITNGGRTVTSPSNPRPSNPRP